MFFLKRWYENLFGVYRCKECETELKGIARVLDFTSVEHGIAFWQCPNCKMIYRESKATGLEEFTDIDIIKEFREKGYIIEKCQC